MSLDVSKLVNAAEARVSAYIRGSSPETSKLARGMGNLDQDPLTSTESVSRNLKKAENHYESSFQVMGDIDARQTIDAEPYLGVLSQALDLVLKPDSEFRPSELLQARVLLQELARVKRPQSEQIQEIIDTGVSSYNQADTALSEVLGIPAQTVEGIIASAPASLHRVDEQ